MKKSMYTFMASALIAAAGITACSGKTSMTASSEAAASESSLASGSSTDSTDASTTAETKEKESTQATDAAKTEAAEDTENETLSEDEITELYRGFARSLQSIIGTKNMNDLAELLVYPSYIGIDGGVTVNRRDEFMALDADKVFTDELIEAVKTADVDSIGLTEAGFIVGDPSGRPAVTIGLDKEGSIGITGINY